MSRELCRQGIGIDALYGLPDAVPHVKVGREQFDDVALVREGWLLQHGQILHHAVLNDIFHDLVHEVDLSAVQVLRPAEEITLWDIYTAVESDETDEIFKLHQNTSETCVVGSNIHSLLMPHQDEAVAAIRDVFSKVTLADLERELTETIAKNG